MAGRQLAARVLAAAADFDQRTELAYKIAFARLPTREECIIAEQFISAITREVEGQPSTAEMAGWTSYCRSLLLTNEFLYVE